VSTNTYRGRPPTTLHEIISQNGMLGLVMRVGRAALNRQRRHITVAVILLAITATVLLPYSLLGPEPSFVEDAYALSTFAAAELPAPEDEWRSVRNLIIVAGHAVFTASDHKATQSEDSWFLETFQHGQLSTMLAHIERGVKLAAADNASLLLFSGGQTRLAAGPRSEASSYWEAADASGWFGFPHVRARAHLEEQARDSFENLLFSLCRFHELVDAYPWRVTVVSFNFKRRRFEELHRGALRFPSWRFDFVGIDPPGLPSSVLIGEQEHSAKPFEHDPFGCAQQGLLRKKVGRNPFRRSVSYPRGCPELAPLIGRCPGAEQYHGSLPWASALRA